MKHVLLLLVFLITGAMPLQAQTPRPEIKILTEIRPEVNYVTHLYTLGDSLTRRMQRNMATRFRR